MDNIKDDAYYVRKIHNDLSFIVKHTEGIEITDLNENELLLDSMLFRLIQISENAKNLSEEYRNAHSEIPWTAIFGFRNRIVHDYGGVDLYVVYYTLKDDIPELLESIKEEDASEMDFLAKLEKSRDHAKQGLVKDADEVLIEMRGKYDL